jgi:cobalt/nickel transport system ATP-binding protein
MLGSTGKTVIVVSHDIEFIWPLQPRILVMKSGSIVADGPAASVMLDRDVLDGARVIQPQIVALYEDLTDRPPVPFIDPLDVRRWLS